MSSNIQELAARYADLHKNSRSDPDEDEDDIFAELEAEIENDDNAALREHGMQEIKRE